MLLAGLNAGILGDMPLRSGGRPSVVRVPHQQTPCLAQRKPHALHIERYPSGPLRIMGVFFAGMSQFMHLSRTGTFFSSKLMPAGHCAPGSSALRPVGDSRARLGCDFSPGNV
jgi:hypothetical protein